MKIKVSGILKILFFIVIILVISYFIIKNNDIIKDNVSGILSDEFMLNYIGLFAGLSLAILSIFYVNIQKIKENIELDNNEGKNGIDKTLRMIFIELRDDTICIIICLLICFVVIIFRDLEIKKIKWFIKFISKEDFFFTIKLSLLIFPLISILDISKGLFGILKANNLLNNKN